MRPDRCPKTVPIVDDQREEDADEEHLRQAPRRNARIWHVQRHEDQRVAEDRDHRPAISPAQFLVEIAAVNDLLRSRLDPHAEQENEKDQRPEFVEGELDVSHDDRHQNTEPVRTESQKDTGQDRLEIVAVPVVEIGFPHGPVAFKDRGDQHEQDPDPDEVKILKQERNSVLVAQKPHSQLLHRKELVHERTDYASE